MVSTEVTEEKCVSADDFNPRLLQSLKLLFIITWKSHTVCLMVASISGSQT